jgi:chromosome segregation ATPase
LNTQKDQLLTFDGQIKSVSITLESLERSLTDLLGRAAEHESAATAVPKKLRDQIAEVRSDIDSQHAEHDRLVRERAATEAGFGAQLDHYRTLRERIDNH